MNLPGCCSGLESFKVYDCGCLPTRPRLAVARSGADLLVSWEDVQVGFYHLETCTNLALADWSLVPAEMTAGKGQIHARVPMHSSCSFFKLRLPD